MDSISAGVSAERRSMKKHKEHYDKPTIVADAEYGIPTSCLCGGRIIDEVSKTEASDTLSGKKFFTCVNYVADGLHFRQPWARGVEEEIVRISDRVAETEKLHWQLHDQTRELRKMKEEVKELHTRVTVLEKLCFEAADSET